jgi:hypothetical protein
MLIVFPIFAAVDETTKRFENLQAKITATPADQRASHAPAAEKIFDDYRHALNSILKQRPMLTENETHAGFLKAADYNTGSLLCKLIEINAVGLIATARGKVKEARCDVHELKKAALAAGLDQSSAQCLPENKEELEMKKPKDCP